MEEYRFNLLYEIYNELLKECTVSNWENRPHTLAITAKRWILDKEIKKCLNNLNQDPLDILNDDLFEMMLDQLEDLNREQKIVYYHAVNFLRDIIHEYERRLKGGNRENEKSKDN